MVIAGNGITEYLLKETKFTELWLPEYYPWNNNHSFENPKLEYQKSSTTSNTRNGFPSSSCDIVNSRMTFFDTLLCQ